MGGDLFSIWYQSHMHLHNDTKNKKEIGPRWHLLFYLLYLFKQKSGKDIRIQTTSFQQR